VEQLAAASPALQHWTPLPSTSRDTQQGRLKSTQAQPNRPAPVPSNPPTALSSTHHPHKPPPTHTAPPRPQQRTRHRRHAEQDVVGQHGGEAVQQRLGEALVAAQVEEAQHAGGGGSGLGGGQAGQAQVVEHAACVGWVGVFCCCCCWWWWWCVCGGGGCFTDAEAVYACVKVAVRARGWCAGAADGETEGGKGVNVPAAQRSPAAGSPCTS
jgi:hypothetical protein